MSLKTIFRAVLAFLILIFSFLTWYFVYASFWHDGQNYFLKIILPLVFFLILGVALGIWFLTENAKLFLWLGPALVSLPFLFIFSFFWIKLAYPWNLVLIPIFLFAFLHFGWGIRNLEQEKSARFKVVLRPVLQPALKPAISAVIILISIIFYFSPLVQLDIKEISLPRPSFDLVFNPIVGLFKNNLIKSNLPDGAAQTAGLPSEVEDQLAAQQQDISDQAFNMVNQMIANAGKPFKKYLPLGLTLSFFFALKIFEMIFLWLIILGVWIIWKILRFFNVIKIKIAQVDKEMIEI